MEDTECLQSAGTQGIGKKEIRKKRKASGKQEAGRGKEEGGKGKGGRGKGKGGLENY